MQIPDFSNTSVFVMGDIMLDRYWSGATNRISPEAPVPVIRKTGIEDRLGGAANVALNLASLNTSVEVCGLIGDDPEADVISALLENAGINNSCLRDTKMSSITKLRLLSRNQQLLRVDTEETISSELQAQISASCLPKIPGKDVIVFSDYGKGTYPNPEKAIQIANEHKIPVLIDPKGNDYQKYRNAHLVTPNLGEFQTIVGDCPNENSVFEKAEQLRNDLNLAAVIVTMSEKGMAIIEANKAPVRIPARAREVYDVTGAGDTVIALLAACLSAGRSLIEAAQVANLAASIVVGKLGTASVTPTELEAALYAHQPSQSRCIVPEEELCELAAKAKANGERVVMTNGCFDLLHPGHLAYLQEAASEGDRLIVAVNDDESVRRLKGTQRPINTLEDRMKMLAGIKGVDWICAFSEDTPQRLISEVLPDLLIKGGDYIPEQIAGYEEVVSSGGEVKVLSFLEGYSSTALIDRIKGI